MRYASSSTHLSTQQELVHKYSEDRLPESATKPATESPIPSKRPNNKAKRLSKGFVINPDKMKNTLSQFRRSNTTYDATPSETVVHPPAQLTRQNTTTCAFNPK
jgi:hypothetical protein